MVYDILPSTTINHDGYRCARHYRHAWLGRKPVSFHSTLFQSRFEPSLWSYPSNSDRNCSGITNNLEGMTTWVFCLRTSASWRWRHSQIVKTISWVNRLNSFLEQTIISEESNLVNSTSTVASKVFAWYFVWWRYAHYQNPETGGQMKGSELSTLRPWSLTWLSLYLKLTSLTAL